jgi:parallel beta-helix repeat protein
MPIIQIGRAKTTAPRSILIAVLFALAPPLSATKFHVDQRSGNASDANPGIEPAPWKTIARAAAAKELRPDDGVYIHSGVYRESIDILVSGTEGHPVTFTAAPNARVVIKGSEVVRGKWTRLSELPDTKEPFPGAYARVWKVQLGDEFFTDVRPVAVFMDKSRRWVSQVVINDNTALQRIGEDPLYPNQPYFRLATVGRGLPDMIQDSFFFDPASQTLYLKILGDPSWYNVEVGVRGYVLWARGVHDVVVRGLELRHNRTRGGQWPMALVSQCQRVRVEDCKFYQGDFSGLCFGSCTNCTVRNCELSYNGDSGFNMGESTDCLVEGCTLLFNNYRRFSHGWHAGGMKCIPSNRRCTVRGCEVAYNIASPGIWFDSGNVDIRILGNVCHHNGTAGICSEINEGGGIIADNLVYANQGRGIYLSGSQNTWIVHNTVAGNVSGIVCMPREGDWTLEDVTVLNNLLLQNTTVAENQNRGSELTLHMGCAEHGPYTRTNLSVHSDYNVYGNRTGTPTLRHSWNPDNTLEQWQKRFGEDTHSRLLPVPFEVRGMWFKLTSRSGLDCAGPLPAGLGWKPTAPQWVGSSILNWP